MRPLSFHQSTGAWVWLLLTVVILSAHWPGDGLPVRIFPGEVSLLTASLPHWQVPLARIPGAEALARWPVPLFAGLAATAVYWICRGKSDEFTWEQLSAAIGISGLMRPIDLFPLLLISGITRSSKRMWLIAGLLGVGITLEFGFVLAFLAAWITSGLPSPVREGIRPSTKESIGSLGLGLFALVVLGVMHAGFFSALLRPLNWIWLHPTDELLPILGPTLVDAKVWLPIACVIPRLIRVASELFRPRVSWSMRLWFAAGLLLAMTCRAYAVLGIAGAFAVTHRQTESGIATSHPRLVSFLGIVSVAVSLGISTNLMLWFSGAWTATSLDVTRWQTSGPVILMNLDDTARWEGSSRFRLLADDRWDVLGPVYPEYAALCRDLREVRDFHYLRADGHWGGYKAWITQWQPTLVVCQPSEVDAIRGLSMSPDWRVMGIDSQQVVFGRAGDPRHQTQIRRVLDCLMTLEWPGNLDAFDPDNTIVSATIGDDPSLARTICSLRFPYAALRYLRTGRTSDTQAIRARCYLDLAHRVAGHSSSGSLLDQYRAIIAVRESLASDRWNERDRQGLVRGLEALLSRSRNYRQPSDSTGQEVRSALIQGVPSAIPAALEAVNDPRLRDYFRLLAASPSLDPITIQNELSRICDALDDGVSTDLRGEVLFYLGCAALEAGDPLAAAAAFQNSAALAPHLPFREIRGQYLRQLIQP